MPNWLDALVSPMVPQGAVRGLRESLAPGSSMPLPDEDPDLLTAGLMLPDATGEALGAIPEVLGHAWNHPLETAGGAASGALEGLRSLTSPAAIAGLLGGAVGKAMGYGGRALGFGDDAARMAGPTLDLIDDIPVPQVTPGADDVAALIGDSQRQMARVPNATGRFRHPSGASMEGMAGRTGGPTRSPQLPPEFVPRGGEAAWNAGRPSGGLGVETPPMGMPVPVRRR